MLMTSSVFFERALVATIKMLAKPIKDNRQSKLIFSFIDIFTVITFDALARLNIKDLYDLNKIFT